MFLARLLHLFRAHDHAPLVLLPATRRVERHATRATYVVPGKTLHHATLLHVYTYGWVYTHTYGKVSEVTEETPSSHPSFAFPRFHPLQVSV